MVITSDAESRRLDEAARAGWLYYVAGNTQDEIAKKLGVSRQSAQRLVSLAMSEKLIKVRLEHPIARCMQLSLRLKDRFRLLNCSVVPSDPNEPASITGLAQQGAAEIERYLKIDQPAVLAFGTGRALRACVEQLSPVNSFHHKVVSLVGNMMSDGSATAFDVVVHMADRVKARHYPMPLPVLSSSAKEKEILHKQAPVKNILQLAKNADVTFVGIGDLGKDSPLYVDNFIIAKELASLQSSGGVGEIVGWVYDIQGKLIEDSISRRVASAPIVPVSNRPVYGIAAGETKVNAILGALRGKLINSLITNEYTAELILEND